MRRIGFQRRLMSSKMNAPYNAVFPSAFTFAHLVRAAAASFALADGLLRLSFLLAAFNFAERIFRALASALISLLRWAAVM